MTASESVDSPSEHLIYHYTDEDGYKAIAAASPWKFEAQQPKRKGNPRGAYFTTLPPDTKNLAERIGVSRSKTQYFFSFVDVGDLLPLNPRRPRKFKVKFYSPDDYLVEADRQCESGENPSWK
jgi:hypothetical protein